MKLFILLCLVGLISAHDSTLKAVANVTEAINELKNQSKTLHDEGLAIVTSFTSSGAGHLTQGLVFQLGILWNFNYDLEQASPSTLGLVDLHILQEGALHRENRFAEEITFVQQVLQSIAHNTSTSPGDLHWKLDVALLEEKYKTFPKNVYSYVRDFEVKNLKTIEAKVKEGNLTAVQLKQLAEEFDRINLSLESIEKKRLYAALVKLENFN